MSRRFTSSAAKKKAPFSTPEEERPPAGVLGAQLPGQAVDGLVHAHAREMKGSKSRSCRRTVLKVDVCRCRTGHGRMEARPISEPPSMSGDERHRSHEDLLSDRCAGPCRDLLLASSRSSPAVSAFPWARAPPDWRMRTSRSSTSGARTPTRRARRTGASDGGIFYQQHWLSPIWPCRALRSRCRWERTIAVSATTSASTYTASSSSGRLCDALR
jgi:hypothetical protein